MEKIVMATFKLRGTVKEIDKIKAHIAALSACEEVVSMRIYVVKIREEKKHGKSRNGFGKNV